MSREAESEGVAASNGAPTNAPNSASVAAALPRINFDRAGILALIRSLFDFQMREIVTTRMMPLIYGGAVAGAGVLMLLVVLSNFSQSLWTGLVWLLFAMPLFLAVVMCIRVGLECVLAIFRILVHLEVVTERTQTIVGHTETVVEDLPRIHFWKIGRKKDEA